MGEEKIVKSRLEIIIKSHDNNAEMQYHITRCVYCSVNLLVYWFSGLFSSAVFIASVLLSVIDAERPNEHISTVYK